MLQAISIEFLKARKLKLGTLSAGIGVVVAILATFSLLINPLETQAGAEKSAWYSILLSIAFFSGLMWPLLTSILASRQIENEQGSGGWMLMSLLGVPPGTLVLAKTVVAGFSLLVCVLVEIGSMFAFGKVGGVTAPLGAQVAVYGFGLWVVGMLNYGFSILVASHFRSSFHTLTFGLINSFITAFLMLIELPMNKVLPWAYYHFISPVAQNGDVIETIEFPVVQMAIFVAVCVIMISFGARRVGLPQKG